MDSTLDTDVPGGPAADFQHRIDEATAGHLAHDALTRASAELVAHLAPGVLGNSPCVGSASVVYSGRMCRATISIEITYPEDDAR